MGVECSVIVLTYNSKFSDIVLTLESILWQVNCEYEIIVTDDGSKVKYIEEIKAYFKEKKFSRFQIVENIQNKGTVKNLYSGLVKANGKYIKALGAGDLLYSKNTLKNLCSYMNENKVVMVFGTLVGYYEEKGNLKYKTIPSPGDIFSYKNNNEDKIKENLIVFGKCISGASMFFRREELRQLISEIQGIVIYCEDWIQVLLVLKNYKIGFIEENVVWYECNSGISNSTNDVMTDKMKKDHDKFFDYIEEVYSDNPYIIRSKRKRALNKIPYTFFRGVLKFMLEPRTFLISYETRKQLKAGAYSYKEGKGFLDDLGFLKSANKIESIIK